MTWQESREFTTVIFTIGEPELTRAIPRKGYIVDRPSAWTASMKPNSEDVNNIVDFPRGTPPAKL